MRLLVRGGAGFIGSHFVRAELAGDYPGLAGARVTVLGKLTYAGNLANLEPAAGHPGLTFARGDICDAAQLAGLVPGHDAVVNFAAESYVDKSIASASDFAASNVAGVQVLLQACLDAGVRQVVQVSTDEIYRSVASGTWTENAHLSPNSPYAAAKAGGDLIALAYARTHRLDVQITRCCNNYGPYQFPEKLIPLFVTNLLDGLQVPLYGDGGNTPRLDPGGRPLPRHPAGAGARRARERLSHQRRRRADRRPAQARRRGLGNGRAGCGPQGPRPPLQYRRHGPASPRLRPPHRVAAGLAATVQLSRENRRWREPLKRSRGGTGSSRDGGTGDPAGRPMLTASQVGSAG